MKYTEAQWCIAITELEEAIAAETRATIEKDLARSRVTEMIWDVTRPDEPTT